MDYLTNDTELTAVADAIREKSETTDLLEWPDGFIQAIEDCETGGPELEWLWGNQITSTLSGTIDSTDDAYAGPILNLDVDGVSTQLITTGKNLFTKEGESAGYINGTGTAVGGSGWMRSTYLPITGGLTYTFNPNSTAGSSAKCAFYDTNKDVISGAVFASGPNTFDAPNDAEWIRVSYREGSYDIQLEIGSTATSYEPYSGGVAVPTPDNPQEILSVDDLALHVCGKNVFDSSILLSASYSSFDGEYYEVNGYWLSRAFPLNDGYPVPIYGKQATLSFDGFNANGENYAGLNFVFLYTDNTRDVVRVNTGTLSHYSLTSNPSKTLKALGFSYNSNYDAKLKNIQLELGSTATAYEPYQGTTVSDLLPEGTSLRSLPDGTKDELHLAYLKPSEREGWAWYSREFVKRCDKTTVGEKACYRYNNTAFYINLGSQARLTATGLRELMSSDFAPEATTSLGSSTGKPANTIFGRATERHAIVRTSAEYTSAADFKTANADATILYPLATPVTTTLDPIELPIMPAENATVWCDGGSAQPTFMLEYIQNANIVISRLEETIADLATS